MTKQEIVDAMASSADISKAAAERAYSACFGKIAEVLVQKGGFIAPKFGSFSVAKRAARTIRNPQTKEIMVTPECWVAKFKPAKTLKEMLNKEEQPAEAQA